VFYPYSNGYQKVIWPTGTGYWAMTQASVGSGRHSIAGAGTYAIYCRNTSNA